MESRNKQEETVLLKNIVCYMHYRVQYCRNQNRREWKFLFKLNKLITNLLVPICQYFNRNSGVDTSHEIIVSLTTFPDRISIVWIAIATIMNQSYKPKRIILWLANEQFPDKEKLPKSLLRLKKRGLEICFCEDIKPHKKYYYSMLQNPNDYVVTIDDDILYPEDVLEQLWITTKKYPNTVCCQYAHKIFFNQNGNVAPYEQWESGYRNGTIPDMRLMPVGCGGVLYPPHSLNYKLFDLKQINALCPTMDDLWLKCMAVLKGTKAVVSQKDPLIYFNIIGTKKNGLFHRNAEEGRNDTAMKAIIKEYPEVQQILREG